ncbi:hypothetical protein DFH09DRAFT_471237 [Mycena vulgaris]|nr:hypothetical protein DFH09DRAFT_471237 [Mycena vulgaris]
MLEQGCGHDKRLDGGPRSLRSSHAPPLPFAHPSIPSCARTSPCGRIRSPSSAAQKPTRDDRFACGILTRSRHLRPTEEFTAMELTAMGAVRLYASPRRRHPMQPEGIELLTAIEPPSSPRAYISPIRRGTSGPRSRMPSPHLHSPSLVSFRSRPSLVLVEASHSHAGPTTLCFPPGFRWSIIRSLDAREAFREIIRPACFGVRRGLSSNEGCSRMTQERCR